MYKNDVVAFIDEIDKCHKDAEKSLRLFDSYESKCLPFLNLIFVFYCVTVMNKFKAKMIYLHYWMSI